MGLRPSLKLSVRAVPEARLSRRVSVLRDRSLRNVLPRGEAPHVAPWEAVEVHIFLSHHSKDKEFVRKLAAQVWLAGGDVWLDEWEIKPGDRIPSNIRRRTTAQRRPSDAQRITPARAVVKPRAGLSG